MASVLGTLHGAAQENGTPTALPASLPGDMAAVAPDMLTGAPHLQTIAQGVFTIDGPITWRVRELTLGSTGAPEATNAAFSLQRSGATVIRNELTGRRVRLDAGEAAYLPAGDPFLRFAVGVAPSLLWTIELLPPDAVGSVSPGVGSVIFTSDAINDYPRGSFETELARTVLLPGEVAILPPYTGPALVVVTSGQVDASIDGGEASRLTAGTSRMVSGNVSLRNATTEPAAIVVAGFGEPIDGVEAGTATAPLPQDSGALPTVPAELPPIATVPAQAPAAPTPLPAAQETVPTPVPTQPPAADLATLDTDGDLIADVDETGIYGTDPFAWDTDGDGLGDGEEAFGTGTDPLSWDSDGDGVSDGEEVNVYGTNPLDPASGP